MKTRCIRFNNLANVDDLLEGETDDIGNIGHVFLVSCWSKSVIENIALWKMYGGDFSGCIIKMPSNMFCNHGMGNYEKIIIEDNKKEKKSKTLFENDFLTLKTTLMDLMKIEYKKKKKIFNPISRDGYFYYDDISVVKYKTQEWIFQKEWRFVLEQFPKKYDRNNLIKKEMFLPYFDLEIDQSVFNKMEIILGPFASKSEEAILDALIKAYNPSCRYTKSKLNIRRTLS